MLLIFIELCLVSVDNGHKVTTTELGAHFHCAQAKAEWILCRQRELYDLQRVIELGLVAATDSSKGGRLL
jgi:hypothetical protein